LYGSYILQFALTVSVLVELGICLSINCLVATSLAITHLNLSSSHVQLLVAYREQELKCFCERELHEQELR